MSFLKWFDRLGNIGVKGKYSPWEIYLTRKLNFLSIVGTINIIVTLLFFLSSGIKDFTLECLVTIILGPCVLILNKKKNYLWAGYLFYFIGIFLLFFVALKMGIEAMVLLYYFPILISLVQIFGRKETLKHLIIISIFFLVSILFMLKGFENTYFRLTFSDDILHSLKIFNIASSFFLTTALILLLTAESIKQEALIKNMLNEKEILLAEVFHRVKNNMNIVTSLLNLKKHSSKSEEVKNALEECRERVYSMALVHQKIYKNKTIRSLDFKDYVNDLVYESVNSIGGAENIDVIFNTEQVNLPINYAIPCGLILNEVITNSFKHAQTKDEKLKLEIGLSDLNGKIIMTVKDNGPGFDIDNAKNQNSLGMDLIQSLTEQLDGNFKFANNNGCVFEMSFGKY